MENDDQNITMNEVTIPLIDFREFQPRGGRLDIFSDERLRELGQNLEHGFLCVICHENEPGTLTAHRMFADDLLELGEMVATLSPDFVRYCAMPDERAMMEHVVSSALDKTLH